ncbi:MAG TPA: hypothetical protein VIJ00_05255 [Nakamurella sp.]
MMRVGVLGPLVVHPLAGDADEAGALAAAVMLEEPLRECGHELAMLAAHRSGSRIQAATGSGGGAGT